MLTKKNNFFYKDLKPNNNLTLTPGADKSIQQRLNSPLYQLL